MNRPARSIEIFTMSALDLFITAMGSFAILMMILYPYYKADRQEQAAKKKERQGNVLFCVWTTRVKDFEQFMKETAPLKDPQRATPTIGAAWQNPGHEQEPDFPVVSVSWTQAQAFCRWLTEKERAAGLIQPADLYRLPTSAEWALAAGATTYPWGDEMPPPKGAGNFGGNEYAIARGYQRAADDMGEYRDDHEMIAPVGSYTPTRDGLFDLTGNVLQWCEDLFRVEMLPLARRADAAEADGKMRVLRGAAWDNNSSESFRSDEIGWGNPEGASSTIGFRCVLEINSPAPAAAAATPAARPR